MQMTASDSAGFSLTIGTIKLRIYLLT